MDIMISDIIPKTDKTLTERGLPEGSYFEVFFPDGSSITEKEANWSSFSQKETVEHFGNPATFYVSNFYIKKIRIVLQGMEATIEDITPDLKLYQFMQSERLLAQGVDKEHLVGRGIGLIKDGHVIEEKFISAVENRVMGIRR